MDQDAFQRAAELLVIVIPTHMNECFRCRRGDRLLDLAMGRQQAVVDHAAVVAAAQEFCPTGQKLVEDYGRQVALAFGLQLPPSVSEASVEP